MRHAHEDEFLQGIENSSVKRNMNTFKREKRVVKEKFDGVEMLQDSYFYDLKVLHNGGQRAKAAVVRRPESAGSPTTDRDRETPSSGSKQAVEASAAERLGDLCGAMKGDMQRRSAAVLNTSRTDPQLLQEMQLWMASQGLAVEDLEKKKKT